MPDILLGNGKCFPATLGVSILDSARLCGLTLDHSCATGRCGICKARLLSGSVRNLGRTEALTPHEEMDGLILTCRASALTDIHISVDDLGLPANIVRKTLPVRIASIEALLPDVVRVRLRLPPTANFSYVSGQYVNVIGPMGIRRSYSIANAPAPDGHLELHIGRVPGGKMCAYWFEKAQANDLLRIDGPIGTFFHRGDTKNTILLATGTGYAPAKAILEDLARKQWKGHTLLLWGTRHAFDHYDVPTFPDMDFTYVPVASRSAPADMALGHVQDILLERGLDVSNVVVYACGSDNMIASARSSLLAVGLDPRAFHSDAFVSSSPESDGI